MIALRKETLRRTLFPLTGTGLVGMDKLIIIPVRKLHVPPNTQINISELWKGGSEKSEEGNGDCYWATEG